MVIRTDAIRDPAGQAIGASVPLPNCASVQACRPLAADGLIDTPAGSVTAIRLTCAVPRGPFWSCGTRRCTLSGSGLSRTSGPAEPSAADGANGTSPQPLAPTGVV